MKIIAGPLGWKDKAVTCRKCKAVLEIGIQDIKSIPSETEGHYDESDVMDYVYECPFCNSNTAIPNLPANIKNFVDSKG